MNEFIAELAVRSCFIAGLGLILRLALTRASAQARAKVLTLTMVCLVILPIAMIVLPRLPITVSRVQEVETAFVTSAPSAPSAAAPAVAWGGIWLAVSLLFVARIVYSLARFRKIESSLVPASDSLAERVRVLTQRVRLVFFSPEGEPPMTWGLVHPRIALPEAAESWQEPQFQLVVLHEEAHIRRGDWAASLGFRAVVAVYWFNPLVWALRYMFEQDSERAADDFVLAKGVDAPEYAEKILEVAKALHPNSGRLPALTMARSHRLKNRLRAILSAKTARGPIVGWRRTMVLSPLFGGALAAGLVVPVTERIPALRAEHQMVATAPKSEFLSNADFKTDMAFDATFNEPHGSGNPKVELKNESIKLPTKASPAPAALSAPNVEIHNADGNLNVNDGAGHSISISGGDDGNDSNEGDDTKDEMQGTLKDVDESMQDAGEQMRKAIHESTDEVEKQIEQAKKDLAKSGLSEADRKAAEEGLKFAKGMAGASIKFAGDFAKDFAISFDREKKPRDGRKEKNKPCSEKRH